VAGYVHFIRNENMLYPACTLDFNGRPCHKKLVDTTGAGNW
jgi:hypothetical protein